MSCLESRRTIEAVIFDMDGTVLDTLTDLTMALNYALEQTGHRHDFNKEEVRVFFGSGIEVAILRALSQEAWENREELENKLLKIGTDQEVLPATVTREEADRVKRVFSSYYVKHCFDTTGPYEGIPEVLSTLRAMGIQTAVVSNKIDAAVKELTPDLFPGMFDVAMGETPAIRRKPYPDMVIKAMEEMGIASAVYVGDSEVDIETAENAGMPCISVSWGFRSRAFLEAHGAEVVVDSPAEILNLIKN